MPQVGIFWGIEMPGTTVHALLADATDLEKAEPYGDFLTHDRSHYDVWEAWKKLGARGLEARKLPSVIAWSEYEDHPRGRIVYQSKEQLFIVYADKRLQRRTFLEEVVRKFELTGCRLDVRSDPHYRRSI